MVGGFNSQPPGSLSTLKSTLLPFEKLTFLLFQVDVAPVDINCQPGVNLGCSLCLFQNNAGVRLTNLPTRIFQPTHHGRRGCSSGILDSSAASYPSSLFTWSTFQLAAFFDAKKLDRFTT